MKKFMSLLLALVMVVSIFTVVPIEANAEEYTCGDYNYILLPDGTAEITRYLKKYSTDKDISIPSTLDGYTVTKIGESAFKGASIQSVVIPNTITSIGYSAFFQCSLKSLEIPDSVKSIGTFAFDYCPLKSVVMADSVEYMGECVFSDCSSLTSVKLSNSLKSIPSNTFYFCDDLVSIDIPDSVTYIDESAFEFCKNLESINFSSSLTTIGYKAFKDCDKLQSVKLPKSLENIGSNTFESCSQLADIELPDSLKGIGAYAFEGCDLLEDIEIPASVTSIGGGIFNGCDNLRSITVNKNNTVYDNRNNCNAIIHTETNKLVVGINSTIIPDSVEGIGDGAFSGCTFSSIEIPDSVHTIGANAFASCISLDNVLIPESVASIGGGAFYKCKTLKNIVIPKNVTSVSDDAYHGCVNAESIEIYTDVDGIMTADPRIVKEATLISSMSYNEIFQLADQGAKVIHPKAVDCARKANIPIVIKNTMSNCDGTIINNNGNNSNKIISGITHLNNRTQVTIKLKDNKNNEKYRYLLNILAENKISLDLINIFPTEQIFTIDSSRKEKLREVLNKINLVYNFTDNCSTIAMVGIGMRGVPGIMAKIMNTLAENSIEILQTADSNMTIWCLIKSEHVDKALNLLHKAFNLGE